MIPVPVDAKQLDWPRKVANAINLLLRRIDTPDVGAVRYEGGTLEHWDGEAWQPIP